LWRRRYSGANQWKYVLKLGKCKHRTIEAHGDVLWLHHTAQSPRAAAGRHRRLFTEFHQRCRSQPRPSHANIRPRTFEKPGMISRVPQKGSTWLVESSFVTLMGLPPKNPQNDDDEDEEDDEDDDEGEEEPAVIREPDEC
jgi:hypothetical protein